MKSHPATKTAIFLALLSIGAAAHAQNPNAPEGKPVPILTGYSGINTDFASGQHIGPTIAPIFLLPLSNKLLVETEGEFSGDYARQAGAWSHEWDKGLEYLQLDYMANRYLTFVAGRYLSPFGIYIERLHPMWIKNLQESPLIFGLVPEASNGGMVRGGIRLNDSANFTYNAYFSATTTNRYIEAKRLAGTRFAFYLPKRRLEIGTSFQRILQGERATNVGADFTWQAARVPFEVRGEYGRAENVGSGYWIEPAFRFRQFHNPFLRRSQAVLRMEQFFAPRLEEGMGNDESAAEASGTGGMGQVPTVDTQRAMAGWNYYINDGTKVSFAYGRAFTAEKDTNVWSIGFAYRFAFPFGGGSK